MSTTLPTPTPASLHTRTWHLHIDLFEQGTTTWRRRSQDRRRHRAAARGHRPLPPGDREVLEIGDELAACRALSGLCTTCSTRRSRTSPPTTRSAWSTTPSRPSSRVGPGVRGDVRPRLRPARAGRRRARRGKNASLGEMYQHLSEAGCASRAGSRSPPTATVTSSTPPAPGRPWPPPSTGSTRRRRRAGRPGRARAPDRPRRRAAGRPAGRGARGVPRPPGPVRRGPARGRPQQCHRGGPARGQLRRSLDLPRRRRRGAAARGGPQLLREHLHRPRRPLPAPPEVRPAPGRPSPSA